MFPAAAVADSGNITNIAPTGTGTIQATFTIDWTTCGYYDCGWWAVAYTRPIGSECLPDIGSIIWVGDLHTGPGHEETTTTFYPPNDQAFNICLYVKGIGNPYLVSLNSYWPPPPTPVAPPAPEPAPVVIAPPATVPVAAPTLSMRAGERAARKALRTWWRRSSSRSLSCDRAAANVVLCDVSWRRKRHRYAGTVTVTLGATGVVPSVRVHRT